MLIGYLLAPAADADALAAQRQALAGAGCVRVVEDGTEGGAEGAAAGQPRLRGLFGELPAGDAVVLPHLGALGLADHVLAGLPVVKHLASAVPGTSAIAVRLYRLAGVVAEACCPVTR